MLKPASLLLLSLLTFVHCKPKTQSPALSISQPKIIAEDKYSSPTDTTIYFLDSSIISGETYYALVKSNDTLLINRETRSLNNMMTNGRALSLKILMGMG